MAEEFSQRGISLIVAHVRRTLESFDSALTEEEKVRWDEFQAEYLEVMKQEGPWVVWRVKSFPMEGVAYPLAEATGD